MARARSSRGITTKAKAKVRKLNRGGRSLVFAIAVLWVLQLVTLAWFFQDFRFENYWFCRDVYRPGLMLFNKLGNGLLPGYFFSPLSPRGALAGFAFASLAYATVVVLGGTFAHRALARR